MVPLIKRCTHKCLHLPSGRKLEDVTVIIKALGLIGDFEADRFHKLKELIGTWPNGDYRRYVFVDPLGMSAANFSSFSAGSGSYFGACGTKYLMQNPSEYRGLIDMGVQDMLPKMKATEEKPCHQYDAKYAMSVGMVVDGNLPRYTKKMAAEDCYFHRLMWAVVPLEKFFRECKQSWDDYQKDWTENQGFDLPYVPYPYTVEMVEEWRKDYGEKVGPVTA